MKPLVLLLATLAILAPAPLAAAQVVVDIGAVENNASGTGWRIDNNVLTIHDGADIVITGTTNDRRVVVEENATVNITLDDVNIGASDFEIRPGADVALTLSGINTLGIISAPDPFRDPFRRMGSVTLVINGPGSLEAQGGIYVRGGLDFTIDGATSFAAISMSNLTINGGTVTASGIGISVSMANITINGGTVTATGTNTGIFSALGSITINGGAITASGNTGISIVFGNLRINGGIVTATGEYADNRVQGPPLRFGGTQVNF